MKKIPVKNFFVGQGAPLTIIAGPCVIESEHLALSCAEFLARLFEGRNLQLIFKSSYDKANRSSARSFRGPGLEGGLKILERIQKLFGLPVCTDVHSPQEAIEAAEVCDIIQIPAFLCRQTDLVVTAGKTGAVINVKKGQFMAPWDMENVVEKIASSGNEKILLTDRGVSFGYNNLVSDFRAIPIMQEFGFPVFYDATHSIQLPGGHGDKSGGEREFIAPLSKAAIAAGCNGIFAEVHPNPSDAKSDADAMLSFDELPQLLDLWEKLYEVVSVTC